MRAYTLHPGITQMAVQDVIAERVRQDDKWGEQNHTSLEWLSILVEEVGEVAKEVNTLHFDNDGKEVRKRYQMELTHVAAVAVAAVEAEIRRRYESDSTRS